MATMAGARREGWTTMETGQIGGGWTLQKLGTLRVPNAGFVSVGAAHEGDQPSLIVSSFNAVPLSRDDVYCVQDIGAKLDSLQDVNPQSLTSRITWPNEVGFANREVMGTEGLLVPKGFIMPWKNQGGVDFLPMHDGQAGDPISVTPPRSGWFYHRAVTADINNDGKEEILTARGMKPIPVGASDGALVWLEPPQGGSAQGPWEEHVIAHGPDSNFRYADIDGDGKKEIVATEFFNQKLDVFWQTADGQWQGRTIDDHIGSAFDVQVVDVNNDGRAEILATNHESDKEKSAVFAYEVPPDFKEKGGTFVRHTLANGFETAFSFSPAASPGAAIPFHPNANAPTGKPWMLVSGDGSQKAYLLTPDSEDPSDWGYHCQTILEGGCTVGNGAVADVDGDGRPELFVPAYEKGEVHVFRLVEPQG